MRRKSFLVFALSLVIIFLIHVSPVFAIAWKTWEGITDSRTFPQESIIDPFTFSSTTKKIIIAGAEYTASGARPNFRTGFFTNQNQDGNLYLEDPSFFSSNSEESVQDVLISDDLMYFLTYDSSAANWRKLNYLNVLDFSGNLLLRYSFPTINAFRFYSGIAVRYATSSSRYYVGLRSGNSSLSLVTFDPLSGSLPHYTSFVTAASLDTSNW